MDDGRSTRAVEDHWRPPFREREVTSELGRSIRDTLDGRSQTLLTPFVWLGIELEKRVRVDARSEGQPGHCLTRMIHNGSSRYPRECVPCKAYLVFPWNVQCVILDVQLNNQH